MRATSFKRNSCVSHVNCQIYAMPTETYHMSYELWFDRRPRFDQIPTFGTIGYLRRSQAENKLARRGAKCIMLGLAEGIPRETFQMRDLKTDKVLFH